MDFDAEEEFIYDVDDIIDFVCPICGDEDCCDDNCDEQID